MKRASLMRKLKFFIDILDGSTGLQLVPRNAGDVGYVDQQAERALLSSPRYDIDECDGRYHDLSRDLAEIMAQIAEAGRQPLDASGCDR